MIAIYRHHSGEWHGNHRLIILGIDGMDPQLLEQFMQEGKMPNFAKLAESADIMGIRVEAPEDLRPALQTALDHDGPCLVDVKVNRQELSMPPTIMLEQALGFSLYMMRAVLSGRADEVIDLVATNLLSR